MRDDRERQERLRKIPPFAYIGVEKYKSCIGKIQQVIYTSLAQNDARFGGDDGIEGALVFGSYAKSFQITEGRTLVHNRAIVRNEVIHASDLDLAYFTKQDLPKLTELNNEDKRLPLSHPWLEFFPEFEGEAYKKMFNPASRLDALIKHGLEQQDLWLDIENTQYLSFEKPDQMIRDLAEDAGSIINGFGLAFVPKTSAYRQKILTILRGARFPIVLDPATTAEFLSPNSSS